MASDEVSNLDERIEVRFSGMGCGCLALAIAPFPGLFLMLPDYGIRLVFAAALGALVTLGLFLIVATFLRSRPIMIVAPEGIYLPIAGDVLLTYDCVEVWAEAVQDTGWTYPKSSRVRYWTFSLQGRPRVWLDTSWWAWIRMVRTNTLLGGDLLLDERFISINANELVAVIEARRTAID